MLLQFHHHHRNNTICSSTFKGIISTKRRRSLTFLQPLNAVEKDSEFELDRKKKAREALKQLDNQLQSLTATTTPPSNIRRVSSSPPSNLNSKADIDRDMLREPPPEYSDSFFAYSAFALLFISVFYNILFLTVIKPSIDGPAPAAYTYINTTNQAVREGPNESGAVANPE
ncbi:hypothetical protein MKW98_017965 [Papaver atlanticum]|uniref:Transmembrane protein n=1 Tax=Papaver atlanticum TaxID=357466 RepID=A0AAD4XTE5_9MAGN|nr:hypothetical protein MKW98_017965 [Papaver atlanticum]